MTSASSNLHGRLLVCIAFAVSLTIVVTAALHAQSTAQKSEKTVRPEARVDTTAEGAGGANSPAAKRQKLRDCGAKWQDEKKAKGLTGKTAYLKFLTACLKG